MRVFSRWGDWDRIEHEDFVYIINVMKEDNPFPDGDRFIPWFYLHITAKSAKKRPYEKHEAMVMTTGKTFNMAIMRKIEGSIRYYLDVWEPKYISVAAHTSDHERRIRLYLSRLETMGYKVKQHNAETREIQEGYYLERTAS